MALNYNVTTVIELFEKINPNEKNKKGEWVEKFYFKDGLKQVLTWMLTDPRIVDIREAAYVLGTAAIESQYSLERWEADFVCPDPNGVRPDSTGIPYGPSGPCQDALDYYRLEKGKKVNYYKIKGGLDPKGRPYFGRGLIQLTGWDNYRTLGNTLNLNLTGNGDLALVPKNSYNIAIEFMWKPRSAKGTSVFDRVKKGQIIEARRPINGSGAEEVAKYYKKWLGILKQAEISVITTEGIVIDSETNQPIPITYQLTPPPPPPPEEPFVPLTPKPLTDFQFTESSQELNLIPAPVPEEKSLFDFFKKFLK
jgi:hypothetical protein